MCRTASRELDSTALAAREGRRFVAAQLSAWGVVDSDPATPSLDDVLLATSELLGNAVRHGGGEIAVALQAHRHELSVEVSDSGDGDARLHSGGPADEGGRGLALVAALATGWGQRRAGARKVVWAAFAVPAGSALGHGCRI